MIKVKTSPRAKEVLKKARQMRVSGEITDADSKIINGVEVWFQKAANAIGYTAKLSSRS